MVVLDLSGQLEKVVMVFGTLVVMVDMLGLSVSVDTVKTVHVGPHGFVQWQGGSGGGRVTLRLEGHPPRGQCFSTSAEAAATKSVPMKRSTLFIVF